MLGRSERLRLGRSGGRSTRSCSRKSADAWVRPVVVGREDLDPPWTSQARVFFYLVVYHEVLKEYVSSRSLESRCACTPSVVCVRAPCQERCFVFLLLDLPE